MITCKRCCIKQPETNYYYNKRQKTYDTSCKECRKAIERARYNDPEYKEKRRLQNKKWKEKNPEASKKSMRNRTLKANYGITSKDYDRMIAEQNFRCKICGTDDPGPKRQYFNVDHCHTTGKVRGILCHHCNSGLGHFRDSIDNLEIAIEYLKESRNG